MPKKVQMTAKNRRRKQIEILKNCQNRKISNPKLSNVFQILLKANSVPSHQICDFSFMWPRF